MLPAVAGKAGSLTRESVPRFSGLGIADLSHGEHFRGGRPTLSSYDRLSGKFHVQQ